MQDELKGEFMRKLAIAMALASTALAAPAVARDQSGYVGVELGGMIVEDTDFDFETPTRQVNDAFQINHKYGLDADIIAGYDFGAVRGEVELGYKRASIDSIEPAAAITTTQINGDGNVRVWSAMANALLDFGGDGGWGGYVGGGLGIASVRYNLEPNSTAVFTGQDFSDSDSGLAWQAIAGVRAPITDNIDLGLKYRYFNASKLELADAAGNLNGRFRSHSLLASLIFNFAPPPPPPPPPAPPPPPPPATQTCPDGSVILATEACPAPPPPPPAYVPPPPPEPTPERG